MIIQVEPTLGGLAESVTLVYDVGEAHPFRVKITVSHRCVAEDLYQLAKAVSEVLVPVQLVQNGRAS